jgi:hypothetical protein
LEPSGKDNELKWRPVVVNLAEFAQEAVTISMVTMSDNGLTVPGGWADPLITDDSKYEQVYYGINSIYENKNYLPRAWVVHRVTQVSTAAEAKEKMSAADFDPASEAVIEGQAIETVQPSDVVETVHFTWYSASSSKAEVVLEMPGFLVFSDLYYPGWKAWVDGKLQPLYATNLTMRGVYVPAGVHQIEVVYAPLSFRIGLYISAATVAFVAILLTLAWKLKRRNNGMAIIGKV